MKKNNVGPMHLVAVLIIIVILIFFGAWYFRVEEGWSYVDSFYFTVMTVTTVGYGDLVPTTDASKIVVSIYSMISLPIVLVAFTVIAKSYVEDRLSQIEKKISELVTREKTIEDKIEKIQTTPTKKRTLWEKIFGFGGNKN